MPGPQQKPSVDRLEKMLADGMSEEQILASYGIKTAAPPPDPFGKLRSDVGSAVKGAIAEGRDIGGGMVKQYQNLEDAPWSTKIGQAIRTGTYGPLVDTVKGGLGLAGGIIGHGAKAVQGNPEEGGRALVDAMIALAGVRGMRKMGVEPGIPTGLVDEIKMRLGFGPPSLDGSAAAGVSRMIPPRPPAAPPPGIPPKAPSITGADAVQATSHTLPVERFPTPMKEWLAESTQGTPSPGKMGVNPEFPFATDELSLDPKLLLKKSKYKPGPK